MSVAPITCKQLILEHLDDYLDASLDVEIMQAFEGHIAGCPACAAYVRTLCATRDLARGAERPAMPAELRSRLRDFLLRRLSGQP